MKFLPEDKVIQVEDRMSIFETILEHNPENIELKFACGAEGICQKCKIRAFQQMGPMTPTEKGCLTDEEINRGVRLACQARVIQDTAAEIIASCPRFFPGATKMKVDLHLGRFHKPPGNNRPSW